MTCRAPRNTQTRLVIILLSFNWINDKIQKVKQLAISNAAQCHLTPPDIGRSWLLSLAKRLQRTYMPNFSTVEQCVAELLMIQPECLSKFFVRALYDPTYFRRSTVRPSVR